MRGLGLLSIVALLLAVATTLLTWINFSAPASAGTAAVPALFNHGERTAIKPEDVRSLRVAQWNTTANSADVFAVAFRDGAWIIPSHYDYPADGGDRVGKTAGSLLNLQRGPLVTQDPSRFAELQVVDPLAAADAETGFGKRVTVEGADGAVLVDLIIGKHSDTADVVYVREAGQDQVYTAALDLSISTAFKDWVETDVLQLKADTVRGVRVQDYSVNEQSGQVEQRSDTGLKRMDAKDTWLTNTQLAGKVIDKKVADAIVSEASGLKLIGVRPYDPAWLQQRGFYLGQKGEIYGNEGSLILDTDNGVRYYLFFGEIALGDAEDTAATLKPKDSAAATKTTAATPTTPSKAQTGDNRYMVVFTRYDESNDAMLNQLRAEQVQAQAADKAKAQADAKDKTETETPAGTDKTEAAKTSDTVAQPADAKPGKPTAAAKPEKPKRDFAKEITTRIAAGKKEAEQKQARFAKFFYVIANSSFEKLRPAQDQIMVAPAKAEAKAETKKAPDAP